MPKTYTGTLLGVEPRANGWYRFHIQVPGMNYPVKLDTKLEQIVQAGASLTGQQVTALAEEQQSTTINPNSGRPYINRYLQNITPAGQMPAPAPAPTFGTASSYTPPPPSTLPPVQFPAPAAQGPARGMDEDTIRRITWLSACSTAASLMQNLLQPGSEPAAVKQAGPVLFTIADAIYARARQVEKGFLPTAPPQPTAPPAPPTGADYSYGDPGPQRDPNDPGPEEPDELPF